MPTDDDSSTESAPKYITAEEIGTIVNAAVTSHLKRSMGSAIEAAMKPVLDKLAAAPAPAPAVTEETDGRRKKQDPEMLAMATQLADLQKTLQSERDRVIAAERRGREDRAYNDLRTTLEGKVRPDLLDVVTKHLFHVEKLVEVDDTGNALFRAQHVPYTGADPEDIRLPLRAGVESYLKSDSAKPFLPAPGTSGASPMPKRGPTQQQGGTDFSKEGATDLDKARRSIERERIAKERLGIR